MLRASSLMQNISNKELVVQIIEAYATIKSSHLFYEGYSETKDNVIEKFSTRQDFQKFTNENNTLKETWNFIFHLTEGYAAIRQIAQIHDDPYITYNYHLKLIDETIAAIDKEYN